MHAILRCCISGFGAHEEVHVPSHVAVELSLVLVRKGLLHHGLGFGMGVTTVGAVCLVERMIQGRERRLSAEPFTDRRVVRAGQPLVKILHVGDLVGQGPLLTPPPGRESGGPLFVEVERGVGPLGQGGK